MSGCGRADWRSESRPRHRSHRPRRHLPCPAPGPRRTRGPSAEPGEREPYRSAPEWRSVRRVAVDREAEDAAGTFGDRIAELCPDVVVDMICFSAASAQQLVDAFRPTGRCWCTAAPSAHGPAARVPVTEDEPRTAYGEYGTGKAAIEALLHRETVAGGVPSVVLHPGHISGPGWPVITPAGNLDPDVWRRLATGEPPRPAEPWAGRPAPCPRGRRCSGLRTGADSFGRDRVELPRGLRAGHDDARTGRRGCRVVRSRAAA